MGRNRDGNGSEIVNHGGGGPSLARLLRFHFPRPWAREEASKKGPWSKSGVRTTAVLAGSSLGERAGLKCLM